jgi:hypothetical protein
MGMRVNARPTACRARRPDDREPITDRGEVTITPSEPSAGNYHLKSTYVLPSFLKAACSLRSKERW